MSKYLTSAEMSGYIDQFLMDQDVRASSRRVYKNGLIQFFKYLKLYNIHEPQRMHVIQFKEDMLAHGMKPTTIANYAVCVRQFFLWTSHKGFYPNIATNIKCRYDRDMHLKDALTAEEATQLMKSIDRSDTVGKRDAAIINLLIRTGLRLVEVSRINCGDIELKKDGIRLWVQGKGQSDKNAFVVLTKAALNPIVYYLVDRKKKRPLDPLFTSYSSRNFNDRLTTFTLSRMVKQRLQESGLDSPRLTAHSLRHTFGTLSMKAGTSIHGTQLALRHSNISSTQVYIKDIEQQLRLIESAEQKIDAILPDAYT